MPFATSGLTFVVLRKMSIPLHTTQWLRRRSDNVYIYYSHVFWIMAKKNYSNVLWCGIETWRNRTIHQGAVYNTLTKRYSTPWNTGFLKMTKGYLQFQHIFGKYCRGRLNHRYTPTKHLRHSDKCLSYFFQN